MWSLVRGGRKDDPLARVPLVEDDHTKRLRYIPASLAQPLCDIDLRADWFLVTRNGFVLARKK